MDETRQCEIKERKNQPLRLQQNELSWTLLLCFASLLFFSAERDRERDGNYSRKPAPSPAENEQKQQPPPLYFLSSSADSMFFASVCFRSLIFLLMNEVAAGDFPFLVVVPSSQVVFLLGFLPRNLASAPKQNFLMPVIPFFLCVSLVFLFALWLQETFLCTSFASFLNKTQEWPKKFFYGPWIRGRSDDKI